MAWNLSPTDTQIIAIHVALLPTGNQGDILCFGDWTAPDNIPQNQYTHSRIYHVASDSREPFDENNEDDIARLPNTNAFCCGQAFLSDGRLLAGGGTFGWPARRTLRRRTCILGVPAARRALGAG